MPAAPLVDSHCHLTWPDFEGDVPAVVERMAAAHVARAVVVATDDPTALPPPRLAEGTDAGWAVSELFEAAWVISGRDPADLRRSPRSRRETRVR